MGVSLFIDIRTKFIFSEYMLLGMRLVSKRKIFMFPYTIHVGCW